MPKNAPSRSESVELTKSLRAAITGKELQNVFAAAGASQVEGEALAVLGETSAAQVADLAAQGRFKAAAAAPAPQNKITKASEAAFDAGELEAAFEEAGVDPQQGRETAAREMARIAQEAVEFAEAEDRPICHNCTAVGAARAASQLSGPRQPQ